MNRIENKTFLGPASLDNVQAKKADGRNLSFIEALKLIVVSRHLTNISVDPDSVLNSIKSDRILTSDTEEKGTKSVNDALPSKTTTNH